MEYLPLEESLRLLHEGTKNGRTVRELLIEHPDISDAAVVTFFANAAAAATQAALSPTAEPPYALSSGDEVVPPKKGRRGRPPRVTVTAVSGSSRHGARVGSFEVGNPTALALGLGASRDRTPPRLNTPPA